MSSEEKEKGINSLYPFKKTKHGILDVIKSVPWLCHTVLQAVKKVNEERDAAKSWNKALRKNKKKKPIKRRIGNVPSGKHRT